MERSKKNRTQEHFIIAIGASAGGLEAINTFFDHIGDAPGCSFIIIQHLSSDHKSFLTELVAKHTTMRVLEAGNEMKVEKQCVYVIPSKMTMTISEGRLMLLEKTPDQIPNNAIDIFLRSLAGEAENRAVAVILSGTGTDGTRGIEYIKTGGGLVVVQDPLTAKFDGMPNNAILSGNADAILSPGEMPAWILQQTAVHTLHTESSVSEEQMQQIFALLQKEGYDFHYYKTPTIVRRITKRMGFLGCATVDQYIRLLNEKEGEIKALSSELVINVTEFFRDREAFNTIYKEVIPQLVKDKAPGETLKLWICACSTGEEAYTYAILLDKYMQEHQTDIEVKIFATDIEEQNIRFAAQNSYPDTIAKHVPVDLLQEYFIREHNRYAIIPRLRKQIVFARHDIVKDPAFIRNDLVSCRNMLIYMNRILQEKILATFHFALNPSGFLVLGTSESAMMLKDGFAEVSGKWKIYSKRTKNLPGGMSRKLLPGLNEPPRYQKPVVPSRRSEELARDFQSALTEQLGYTAIFIDNRYEIKEAIGNYAQYLSLPQQNLKLNLLSMLPRELEILLGNAIRRSWYGRKEVALHKVPFRKGSNPYIDILVQPAASPNDNLTMIVMSDARITDFAAADNIHESVQISDQNEYLKELELQLADTRDNLQLAIEGLETSNEELQSANEELLSSNEELQSSNEELQSLNEELHTLNAEHQAKIKELIELNDDLDNYFRSAEIGQIFLDAQLNIRKFNPNAQRFINLIESDIGRPISHISNNLRYPALQEDIQKVQDSGKMLETEIDLQNGRISIIRIYPYVRKDKMVDGLVLTFIDVTDVKNLYGVVNGVFDSSLNPIIVLGTEQDVLHQHIVDFNITAVNHAAEALLDHKKDHLTGQSFRKMAPNLLQLDLWDKLIRVAENGKALNQEYHYLTADGDRYFDLSAVKINNGIMITYNDITQKKNAEKRLKKNYHELIITRESLKELNTRLEEEVASRTRELSLSEERFRLVSRATNDVIKDWDLVNNQVWNSDSFFSLFHFGHEEVQPTVDFWFDQIHEEDLEPVKQGIFSTINTGDPQWTGEYRLRNGRGQYVHVLERGYILKDEVGMPYRMISSLMDITTLKKAEEATRELLQKKDEFMSIASHELKTPITSMKASLQIVERIIDEGDGRELAKDFIRKANDQVDKLTTLVENLLDVTKIQAGKMEFNKSVFDISTLIDDCVYHIQNLSRNPITVLQNTTYELYADQHRIEQVVLNFLSNAVKYSPEATEIRLNSVVHNGQLKVEIKDQGIGISAENIPHVFDRFFRGFSSSEKFSGLGLGLYISADIIRRHGGEVGVDSQLGSGSTFWFTLPLAPQSSLQKQLKYNDQ